MKVQGDGSARDVHTGGWSAWDESTMDSITWSVNIRDSSIRNLSPKGLEYR